MNIEGLPHDAIEIELKEPTDFLKCKETLERIGVASRKDNTLYQSCHILHKRGKYLVIHFKELFVIDGGENHIDDEDIQRRNRIAKLLDEWGLCKVLDRSVFDNMCSMNKVMVIGYNDRHNWNLKPKYKLGK